MQEDIDYILDKHGFDSMNKMQKMAMEEGVLDDGNKLLVAETGNGKTFCAEVKIREVLREGGKVAYLVPSRQLVRAKKEELEEWCEHKVYSSSTGFDKGNITVTTFESYNASLLNGKGYTSDADLVVLDDFHEIYSRHRGPGIEKTVTSLLYHDIPIFAMSATVGNPDEIADWMDADLIESEEGREIDIEESFMRPEKSSKVDSINSFIKDNTEYLPALVFNSRRSYCESRASNLVEDVDFEPSVDYREKLDNTVNQDLTPKLEDLAECMNNGVAFHHAGLPPSVKEMIEEEFEKQNIKVIYCTTTIAYGFDAPVKSIIVGDIKRYFADGGHGYMDYIGVWEYVQWIGRAGRPGKGFDDAYSFVFTKNPDEAEEKFGGSPKELEDIKSHIENEENFRWLMLELIHTGRTDPEVIKDFYSNTLMSQQMTGGTAWGDDFFNPGEMLEDDLRETSSFLKERSLINESRINDGFQTTSLGDEFAYFSLYTFDNYSISTLYSFYNWYDRQVGHPTKRELVAKLSEVFRVQISGNKSDMEHAFISKLNKEDYGMDDKGQTTCLMLEYWSDNMSLKEISEKTGIDTTNMKGVASAMSDTLSNIEGIIEETEYGKPDYYDNLVDQIKYGVPEEDLNIVKSIDNFGRYRLRNLKECIDNMSTYHEISGSTMVEKIEGLEDKLGYENLVNSIMEGADGVGKVTSRKAVEYATV